VSRQNQCNLIKQIGGYGGIPNSSWQHTLAGSEKVGIYRMNMFRRLVAREKPLVLPGAHDAISARLIQRAGFKAYFIGGFPLVGARYGVPDIGLMGLGEIGAGIRDIMAASDLPVLVDCDNGYGDVKTVVHTINTYERLGAQAVFFEDQISPKRCGHIYGKRLLSTEQMEANIRAAAENRINPETFIIARSDAREVFDLNEALRRGERYIRAGADGLFIEAPVDVDELERIGRAFNVPQLANMLEGGRTPFLTPAELEQLGFRIVIYGISLLMHAVRAMENVLAGLAHGEIDFAGKGVKFEDYKSIVGLDQWAAIETKYQPTPGTDTSIEA
jgi:2,3-dimethylmalate lyase